jgi:hypothetical protein
VAQAVPKEPLGERLANFFNRGSNSAAR